MPSSRVLWEDRAMSDNLRRECRAMAREICLHRGENPNAVNRQGQEDWEKYESLARACIREAERLFALRETEALVSENDILYKLRDLSPGYGNIIKEAIDEIERLRASAKHIGCILCANGDDLPEGEQCAGCGREGNATGLRSAVIKARGRNEPPSKPIQFDGPLSPADRTNKTPT